MLDTVGEGIDRRICVLSRELANREIIDNGEGGRCERTGNLNQLEYYYSFTDYRECIWIGQEMKAKVDRVMFWKLK